MKSSLLVVLTAVFCLQAMSESLSLPKSAPVPKDNPMSLAKIELGRTLFFDPRLSKNGAVSCNSCHNVMAGGEDNRSFSVGVGGVLGGRSAPTVFNSAFNPVQFWDGRAASLEDQAKGPMTNPVEMAMADHDMVVNRIRKIPGYKELFVKAFGNKATLSIDETAKAIAAYERTLITPNSKFDRHERGDKKALNEQELRGYKTVKEVGCTACHSGPMFNGAPLSASGNGFYMKFPTIPDKELEAKYGFEKDQGRYQVTKAEGDRHMYRVPTWRNIALTAPYFHNGSVATLDEAVRVMAKLQLGKNLDDAQVKDIVAFLKTLTGERPRQTMPLLPVSEGETLVETN